MRLLAVWLINAIALLALPYLVPVSYTHLATWLNTSPDLWVGMQTQCDLWAAKHKPRPSIRPLERLAA